MLRVGSFKRVFPSGQISESEVSIRLVTRTEYVHFIGSYLGTSGLFLVFRCCQLCDVGLVPPDGVERSSRRPFGHSSSCLV